MSAACRPAGQAEMRNRGDAGQRLAAKAETGYAFQVFERMDLAGGMARQRKCQLFPGYAAAIVGDTDLPEIGRASCRERVCLAV